MRTFKKNIKYIIGLLLIGGLIWFAYDIHFKFVINEYQGNQIEKRLKADFVKNSKGFEMIKEIESELGNFSDLYISKTDDYISFSINSDSLPKNNEDWVRISAGETSDYDLKFIGVSKNNGIVIQYENEKFTIKKPWIISYEGKETNPDLEKVLSLKKNDLKNFNTIEKLLKETNSIGFEKNDSIIKLRYAGHWGESYNYITTIQKIKHPDSWNKLSEEWYSFYYRNGLFCGYTDW